MDNNPQEYFEDNYSEKEQEEDQNEGYKEQKLNTVTRFVLFWTFLCLTSRLIIPNTSIATQSYIFGKLSKS